MVRADRQRLVRVSRVFVLGAAVGPFTALSGCAYELSEWQATSSGSTVTVPETSDDEESSTGVGAISDTGDMSSPQTSSSATTSDETPSSGETLDPCDNAKLDEGETAVDCGGDDCQPCGLNLPCLVDGDCQSGLCSEVCLAAGCENGEIDGKESDEDCGGDCEPCADDAMCHDNTDCESGVCEEDVCKSASCDDGVKNGGEADEDCGTEECGLCENGASCTSDDQCEKGACKDLVCADPQCNDTRKNGTETDVDCGGTCPPCGFDEICRLPEDCDSHVCLMTSASSGRCASAACPDGQLNGNESDVDCGGGGECPPCADGAACKVASDCESSVCDGETLECAEPSCSDEVRNGEEMGIDCGGGCDGCPDGTMCGAHSDCVSNSCDGTCQEASCEDGRQNPNESDLDCGGSCGGCSAGGDCDNDADCLSNDCATTCQPGVVGSGCQVDGDCLSDACDGDTCIPGFRGASCESGVDCQSGYCKTDSTCGSGDLGDSCEQGSDCASNLCSTTCSASRLSVRSDSGTDTAVVKQNMQVQANASDPARTWQDVAFLYFFSVVSPETHGNFQSRYYNGPNQATRDSRFLAINGQGTDWVMIWRAIAGNTTTIPSASMTQIELQLNNSNWSAFNQTNDYSYRTGGYAENTKIVVCQRVDGRWAHTQGTPPTSYPDPCSYVVDSCSGTAATCDVLERAD